MEVVPAIVLGAIHGGIRVLDQGFAVRAMVGKYADAEAATSAEQMALNRELSAHRLHEPISGDGDIGYIFYGSQHDHELVAA